MRRVAWEATINGVRTKWFGEYQLVEALGMCADDLNGKTVTFTIEVDE